MTDSFGLQASFNIPSGEQYEKGDLVNIRGSNPQEFHANLLAFDQQVCQLVAQVGANLRAVVAAMRGLGAHQISHDGPPPQQNQQQGAPEWAQNPQNGPDNGYQSNGGGQGQSQGYGGQNGYQSPYGSGQQQQQQQQQGNGVPTQPPPHVGPAPQCSHGMKRFIAKPYKNGKPGYWMAWACPAQQGDNSQHELEFIRNS